MEYRQQLLTLSETLCRHTGRSEARLATIIRNQGAFFTKVRNGAGCTVDIYLQVKRWFSENWPEGLAWPEGVDRPDMLPDGEAHALHVPAARVARIPGPATPRAQAAP